MIIFEKWKSALIGFVVVAAAVIALPNVAPIGGYLEDRRINLGLDLQGGSYLQLQVDIDSVIEERLGNLAEAIRTEMRGARVAIRDLDSDTTSVTFTLRRDDDVDKAKTALSTLVGRDLQITPSGLDYSIAYTDEGLRQLAVTTVDQAIEIVRNRIDETGTKEPIIQRQGRTVFSSSCPVLIIPKRSSGFLAGQRNWAFSLLMFLLTRLRFRHRGGCHRARNCCRRWTKKARLILSANVF